MSGIRKAIKKVREVETYRKEVDSFALGEYNEKFPDINFDNGKFHYYDGFELLSDTEIKVNYIYGVYDAEYCNFFIVTIH